MVLSRMLRKMGFDVEEAGDGREAIEVIDAKGPPDLALVDWNMPEMNGYEFVQAVREREDCADLRLVMVTTESESRRIRAVLEAGADEYVMKPFVEEALTEKLALVGFESMA